MELFESERASTQAGRQGKFTGGVVHFLADMHMFSQLKGTD
jgi:hypothetical protein